MPTPEEGPKDIEVRPEQMDIPPEVERATGAQTTQYTPPKPPTDDAGQPLVQPTDDQGNSIVIPADQNQLTAWSKGDPDDSLTWFGAFWLRLIRKAVHFGWRVFQRKEKDAD
ncbi:hypothetical protein A2115_02710 [Candidatus Woesebacteria bacterium GWA1_41_8]|jgi:hypothetical protein|uniref:Uncharacterized protein n=1 Tax=Candidatus Woesebacteria bacterium GWA1_41_8 TaxID=1802471 RepID=A0A1F7WJY6_9BACT|nr:MAG: hypothetical protein A2115_02710 [Candidatus Woesebacteria bacterium GWA1_41_8]